MAAVAALLLALAAPTQAQDATSDATSSVAFDGVGFSFSHTLGRSVNILRVPAGSSGETQEGEASPAHIVFSLYRSQAEGRRVPRPWDVPGTVNVYRSTALEGYPIATRQLTTLQRLLAERPDPATLEASDVDAPPSVPYLPIPEAGQPIVARVAYIDTPELSGVAYVTGFRQDVSPFARDDFWYTFQGLSADGQWYVAVNWVIRAGMFPRTLTERDYQRAGSSASRWSRYIRRSVATLDAAAPTEFRPSLDTLDALVRSIDFASVVAPSQSPTPSLAPTVTPEPTSVAAASAAP